MIERTQATGYVTEHQPRDIWLSGATSKAETLWYLNGQQSTCLSFDCSLNPFATSIRKRAVLLHTACLTPCNLQDTVQHQFTPCFLMAPLHSWSIYWVPVHPPPHRSPDSSKLCPSLLLQFQMPADALHRAEEGQQGAGSSSWGRNSQQAIGGFEQHLPREPRSSGVEEWNLGRLSGSHGSQRPRAAEASLAGWLAPTLLTEVQKTEV